MGVRPGHRTPIFSPGRVYFRAGLLLVFSFGITLGALEATYRRQEWFWFAGFATAEVLVVALYFWIVAAWLGWMTPTSDYTPVDRSVDCPHGHDHHSGEHFNP